MLSKSKFYLNYITKVGIILIVLFGLHASTSKTEAVSTNENINKSVDLSTMAIYINKEEEAKANEEALQTYLWGALDSYTGSLTGYGADCALCTGRLACNGVDVRDGTDTYIDNTYGEVRIVASSSNLPCGSIIRFESSRISDEPIIAIVLDRGVLGNNIDLLTPSEDYAYRYIGRSTITYDVLRIGWEK
mgnify:FL=1